MLLWLSRSLEDKRCYANLLGKKVRTKKVRIMIKRSGGRAAFLSAVAAVALVAGAIGCGGGGDDGGASGFDIQTGVGGSGGDLNTVAISPSPGSVFVGRATPFNIAWNGTALPPLEFSARLQRYLEPIGGESRSVTSQDITVSRVGQSFAYNIRRRDDFDLDGGGVYYLELTAPGGQTVRSTYIASNNRSASVPPARISSADARAETITRAATENPGTTGNLGGLRILPAPGATFIPKTTVFQLRWDQGTPPPAEFTVQLRRYKERRGSDNGGDSEQRVTLNRQGNTEPYVYNLRRTDNFNLDGNGVYYIEVTAPGQDTVRAAYTVSDD